MLFAQTDELSLIVLVGAIGLMGEGIHHLTDRMLAMRSAVRTWAIVFGIVSGVIAVVLNPPPNTDPTTNPLLTATIGGAVYALVVGIVWYFVIAVLTFLFLYLVVAPFRFLGSTMKGSDAIPTKPRSGRGWVSVPIVGVFFGFICGVLKLGTILISNPNLSPDEALTLIGTYAAYGAIAGLALRISIRFLTSGLSWSKGAIERRAVDRRERDELLQIEAEMEQQQATIRRKDAALQRECDAARKHLTDFYAGHRELLLAAYPPALMDAFVMCDMHDGLKPAELWSICQKKIAELQPIILQERAKKKLEDGRLSKRNIRAKQIDSDIKACQEKVARLAKSGLDADLVEDETHGLMMKIRQLEEQKDLLMALHQGGDA